MNIKTYRVSLIKAYCRQLYTKGGIETQKLEGNHEYTTHIINVELVCEVASVKIKLGKSSLSFTGVYRPRNNVVYGLKIISEAFQQTTAAKHPTILICDIKIHNQPQKK